MADTRQERSKVQWIGSTSTKTSMALSCYIALVLAANVKLGQGIMSPLVISKIFNAKCKAAVADD